MRSQVLFTRGSLCILNSTESNVFMYVTLTCLRVALQEGFVKKVRQYKYDVNIYSYDCLILVVSEGINRFFRIFTESAAPIDKNRWFIQCWHMRSVLHLYAHIPVNLTLRLTIAVKNFVKKTKAQMLQNPLKKRADVFVKK